MLHESLAFLKGRGWSNVSRAQNVFRHYISTNFLARSRAKFKAHPGALSIYLARVDTER